MWLFCYSLSSGMEWFILAVTLLMYNNAFLFFSHSLFFKYSSTLLYSLQAENIIVAQKIIGTLLTLALWDCVSFSCECYCLARLLLKPKQNFKKGIICILKVDCWDGNSCVPLTEKGLARSITKILLTIFSLNDSSLQRGSLCLFCLCTITLCLHLKH